MRTSDVYPGAQGACHLCGWIFRRTQVVAVAKAAGHEVVFCYDAKMGGCIARYRISLEKPQIGCERLMYFKEAPDQTLMSSAHRDSRVEMNRFRRCFQWLFT